MRASTAPDLVREKETERFDSESRDTTSGQRRFSQSLDRIERLRNHGQIDSAIWATDFGQLVDRHLSQSGPKRAVYNR